MKVWVDSDVPSGNVADVTVEERDGIATVGFTPHPHGEPEALWFHFRVVCEGAAEDSDCPLALELRHVDTVLGATRLSNLRPVIRRAGGDWERLLAPQALETPDGRRSARWQIPSPGPSLEVALCYPYGLEEVEQLARDCGPGWNLDSIGVSQEGRPLLRLSNSYGAKGGQRPGLYLVARQHAGEVSASWVLDGFLRALAEMGDAAPIVWAVPLAHIDGVARGDHGKDGPPHDLNRSWGRPALRHEVLAMQQDLLRWQYRCRPALCLDFHAQGASEAAGLYALLLSPDRRLDLHLDLVRWSDVLEASVGESLAAQPFARVPDWPSRETTPSFPTFVRAEIGAPALTVSAPYAMARERILTREAYREAGARMARRIADLL